MREKWTELPRRLWALAGRYQYVLLVLAAGALLLLLPAGGGAEAEPAGTAEAAEAFDLEEFEEKLAAALSRVQGAGETRVVLSLDSGSRTVLAQDVERQEGGGASTVVTVGRGSGSQEVVPLQTVAPSFRGALVVCPGGGDPQVRLRLVEAVSALTGLGSDRISVCRGEP